jgi:hypothetical protein
VIDSILKLLQLIILNLGTISLFRLESTIEEDYLNSLRQACFREKSYSKSNFLKNSKDAIRNVRLLLFLKFEGLLSKSHC